MPDGTERETFAWTREDLNMAVAARDWIKTVCAHPNCDEPCTERDYCPGCGAYVCWLHSKDVPSEHRRVEDHWRNES
jgi:hypothetical protein